MSETEQSLGRTRPERGPRLALTVALIAFAAGIAAMAAVYQIWGAGFGQSRTSSVVEPVEQALSNTTEPVEALPSNGKLTALEAREVELNDRIAELEARLANVDNDSRVASSFASRAEGLLIAFAARRALDRGLSLGYLEDQLRLRFSASEPAAVATIIQAAHEPVTLEELRLALDTLAPKLVARNSDEGWWTVFRRETGNLVVIRQESAQSPLPADRLTRARRMLDAGQVEAALAEVAKLPGAPDAQGWLRAARRYIAARTALDSVETAAIQGRAIPVRTEPAPVPSPVPTDAVTPPTNTPPQPAKK